MEVTRYILAWLLFLSFVAAQQRQNAIGLESLSDQIAIEPLKLAIAGDSVAALLLALRAGGVAGGVAC